MTNSTEKLRQRLQAAEELAVRMSSEGGMGYLKSVVIASQPEPRPFRVLAQPWQWERAQRIVPALDWVGGFTQSYNGPLSFAETYARGHDKTSFLGRLANWLVAFSRRHLDIIVGAGDMDQAGLVMSAMQLEAGLNPWLHSRLKFTKKKVIGRKPPYSQLELVATDAKSAFGLRGNVYILDEITHWPRQDFWEALSSGRSKMPGSALFLLGNAGLIGTWQHDLWEKLKKDESWSVFEAPGQMKTWMDPAQIARDRALIPAGQARRLFDNQWIDPAEEAGFLTREDVQACADLGRDMGLTPQTRGRSGCEYVASIDYGPKRDRTVLTLGHQEPGTGLILIDQMSVWQGSPSDPVKIAAVRGWLDEQLKAFPSLRLVIDPYQMEDLAQTYEARIPVRRFEARGGKSNYQLAACLRSLICNRQIAWYPGAGDLPVDGRMETIVDEISTLVTVQMTYGYRIDHELTRHDDRAVSLGMLALEILERPAAVSWVPPTKVQTPEVRPAEVTRLRAATPRILWGVDHTPQGRRRWPR